MSDPDPSQKRPPKIQRAYVVVLVSMLALVALGGAVVGIAFTVLSQSFDSGTTHISRPFPAETVRPTLTPTTAENILLLGSDTRGELDATLDSAQGGRSDTMMVVHIPANRKNIQVMSIMRDSWVDIPGYGENKINAAMVFGGIPLTIQTVESLINARIDHVAIIDFSGFKQLTTSLGGVEVDNALAFSVGNYYFDAGPIQISGEQALAYVRERHAFIDGDYQRVKNQQAFLKAVFAKYLSRQVLTDPIQLVSATSSLGKMLTVDSGLTFSYFSQKAVELRSLTTSDITFFTLPSTGTGMVGDQSVVFVNWPEVDVLKTLFSTDTLDTYVPPEAPPIQ